MSQTVEEFFDSNDILRFLRDNIKCNIEVICEDVLDRERIEQLHRLQLIVIRQCFQSLDDLRRK